MKVLTITTSIQHCSLGPSQCSKIRKRRRKNKTEKEETKLSFPDDMIITDKLLELTRDSNKFTRHKISL